MPPAKKTKKARDIFKIEEKILANGLKTILLPRKEGDTVTFLVLIGVGSRYETARQNGLSHFLEHMFFKGTTKRPTTKEIAEAIDEVGGEFNAFTGEEYTGYYVKVAAEHLERGADVVSDILLHPLFPPEEIEREKGVIVEEIRMYTDSPMRHIWHLWNEAMFGAHPLGRRIDGSAATVNSFQQKDFRDYTQAHYHTGNAVVTVAGKFNPRTTSKLLDKLFADLSRGRATHPKVAPRKQPAQRFVHERRPSLDQTHLMVGVPGLDLSSPDRWTAEVLAAVLGGGMSSRMFISIRERQGLAYSIKTMSDPYTDSGSFVTQAGVTTSKAPQALKLIMTEYDRVMEEDIPAEELHKAKQMLRGSLVMGLEETNSLAQFAGAQKLLRQKVTPPQTIYRRLNAVSALDVRTLAKRLLNPKKRAVALLGPQQSTKAFSNQLVK